MNIRFVFAVNLCLLSYFLGAQNILSEDFQQGIPGTWTLIDNDGRTPDSTQTDFVTAAWVAWPDPGNGSNTIAVSTSKYLPAGQADDWLITPAITLESNSILYWNAIAFNAAADGYEVRISTTTPTIGAFLSNAPLFTISAENTSWTKRFADLTAYPNQTVYIAFRNNSNDKFLLGIDDVVVFDCNTINANAGTIDTSTTEACAGFPELNLGLSPSYNSSTPTTNISGNTNDIANWAPLPGRPFHYDGDCCEGFQRNPPYQMVAFEVTVTGNYTIVQTPTGYDGIFYIYTDPLDLSGPLTTNTYLGGVDDFGTDMAETLVISLNQGQQYYLISSGYATSDSGNYSTSFSGPGSILVQQVSPADLPFEYNFVVSNSNGIIVSIGDDLTNTSIFPGSLNGDTFMVCGISFVPANLNLQSFIGQSYASLTSIVNSNSCADLTSACHTVVIKSGAPIEAGIGDSICVGGAVTLAASGGTNYTWSTGEQSDTILVAPLYTTMYSVTATDNIGCTGSDNVTVVIYASDGGKFDPGPTTACEGDSSLNFSLSLEFTKNFFPTQTNLIIGNTVHYFTWAPLPGRPQPDDGSSCVVCYNPLYDIKSFQVDQTGYYFIHQSQINYDGVIYLYTDPFDLTINPPITFIAGNDDSAFVYGQSYLDSVFLESSTTYYLISTGFDAGDYGDYITTLRGAGNLLLPGEPDTTLFGFEYLVVDSSGIIKAFSQDLSDPVAYPGSAAGNNYQVCAVSYLKDSVDISPYLGQPFSSLQGAGCLAPSENCHSVLIFNSPFANTGPNDTICFNDTARLAGNFPTVGQGEWSVIFGSATFADMSDPQSKAYNLSAGINMLVWTVNNGGCSQTDTMEVFSQAPLADAGPDDSICRGESAILMASGGVSYSWSNNQTTPSISVSPVTTTIYTVTVTDIDGCSIDDDVTVVVNQLPVVDVPDASICSGSTTILDAGNPGASYSWSTGAQTQTISASTPGTYSVVVIDSNGCSGSDSAVVSIGTGLTVVLNDAAICMGDSVLFNAGNPGSTYSWSTGESTQTIKAGDDGIYSVTVVDANNCTGIDSATVTVNPSPPLSVSNDTAICEGGNLTLTATGAGTFLWNTGATSSSINVNPTQDSTFSVTLTAANSCTSSDNVTVMVNQRPVFDLGPGLSLCRGESATLTASGGTQYSWNTGDTTASITVSPSVFTAYSVTVATATGCSASDNVSISVKIPPIANAGTNDTICEGEVIMFSASGGGAGYSWSTGSTSVTITVSPSSSQQYSVTVTASNGCTASDNVYVLVYPVPALELGPTIDYCDGSLLTLSAPSGGSSYLWNTGDTTEYIDVMPATNQTYSVTVTTDDGCAVSDSVGVVVRPNVTANAGPDEIICDGEQVTLTASGGTIYRWSNGSSSSIIIISPSATQDYTVTVSNAFGCEDVDAVNVTVKETPSVTLFGFDTTFYCIDHDPIVVAGSPTGGVLQGSGISNGQFFPANAGAGTHLIVYSLTGANGCTGVDTEEITVDLCNGIAGISNLQVLVYPNPTEQIIFIETDGLTGEATVNIFDAVGRRIFSQPINNEKMRVDLSSYSSGTYLLHIKHSKGLVVKQIVKN